MTLVLVVLALLVIAGQVERALTLRGFGAERAAWHVERASLLNRLAARTPAELVTMERAIPTIPVITPAPEQPVPVRSKPVAVGME